MKISNNGPHMFTLSDAVNLLNNAYEKQGLSPQRLQVDSALKGDYVLADTQALNELERVKSRKHALDNPNGYGLGSIAGGKLPVHPTFSKESPYNIDGFRSAQGGQWSGEDGNWTYRPSQSQIDRDPEYLNKLHRYYSREKGNGIDNIEMPKGLAATYITEAQPSVGLSESTAELKTKVDKSAVSLRVLESLLNKLKQR